MFKNIMLVLLAAAVLVMAGLFVAPRLGVSFNKKPFSPADMANEIMLEVGASSVSTGLLCGALEGQLGDLNSTVACQPNRYSATEAKDRIDQIVNQYNVEPNGDWSVDEAGYGRSYGNADESSVENIMQSVLVMVSSDVVIVSYDE